MDGLGSVESEHVPGGEVGEALDESNELESGDWLLQNDGDQKFAFREIALRGETESALRDRRCDVLDSRGSGLDEPVPVFSEQRPSAIGHFAEKTNDVIVVCAHALLAALSVQPQTEHSFHPKPVQPERRHVPIQNRAQNQLRGGARAEVGLAAGLVAVGIHGRHAEERAK